MAYKALYRTYRPNSFDEVAGQKYIVRTLQNAVDQKKIAHAYLFCGPRGTGKTSIAKIFAKAVNCENDDHKPCLVCENCKAVALNNHPDIVEIDAASNNGVEEVRNLIEKVKYAPIKGKYKVYIIDEVHMMSTGAFNALLKTIEEPPAHVIFILATTEPHKVLPTIISRCQRFDFTNISSIEIVEHIKGILLKEDIQCENEVIRIISQLADGGMRDALSILDQCIAYAQNDIKVQHIHEIYGITTTGEKLELFTYIYSKNIHSLLEKVKAMLEKGIDIKKLTFDLIEILKDSIVYEYTKDETLLKELNKAEAELLNVKGIEERLAMIDTLMDSYDKYRFAANVGAYFEVCLLKLLGNNDNPINVSLPETKFDEVVENFETKIVDLNIPSSEKEENTLTKEQFDVSRETSVEETIVDEIDDMVENSNFILEEQPEISNFQEDSPVVENQVNTEVKESNHSNSLDDGYVLQLLVGANKPEKQHDMECFMDIERYTVEVEWAKSAHALKNTEIMASATSYIVLTVDTQAEANEINDRDSKQEFKEFTNILLHRYKKVFAVTYEQKNRVIEVFKDKMKSNTLPEPIEFEIEANKIVEEKEKTEMESVLDLFGEGNIIITEE